MHGMSHYIAIDLGAESGRVMLAHLTDDQLSLEEMHRFPNGPIEEDGALRWDFARLMQEIKIGIKLATERERRIDSIGVDTWGVDFGLLDVRGQLIENPTHYRDKRTDGMMEEAFKLLPKEEIYYNTGIQFLPFNTIYQLLALKLQRPEVLQRAHQLLFMPDLIMYFLTGDISVEYTMASTSQLMDMHTKSWSKTILKTLDLPRAILPDVIKPGTPKGMLLPELAEECGCSRIPVMAVGTHDTASSVAAVPTQGEKPWAYLSSGTWSLMGIETQAPIINDTTCALSYTNEGGLKDTIHLLKNIMGLWIVQECKRQWEKEGQRFDYTQLTKLASEAAPFTAVIDVDDHNFLAPGQMPAKIQAYLTRTGQSPLLQKRQILRTVLESLALRYDIVMKQLEQLSGQTIEHLHIVDGGIKNELLNQLTADATGKTVIAGPVEATVIGNVLMQTLATENLTSLKEGRALVARSFESKIYTPQDEAAWETYRTKATQIINN